MYVPSDVEWFIAEQIEAIYVGDQPANLVYVNSVLVRANDAKSAYERAVELGRLSEHQYENPDGQQVRVVYRGLRDLYPIHDRLEDGAELSYESLEDQSEEQIGAMARDKHFLELFAAESLSADSAISVEEKRRNA